ncbi:MAG: UDP-2,3-diacylglucosamine diphosphatase [Syntrophobacterales bacterium]|jgi:UDP-2,3-diacylglucosamine hydrolase|nr:UDP-2,3-diacylglucosamine diphosphatase [Syntrophobacterales bacterium]
MKIIFFSDTHLDKTDEKKQKIVKNFLREACSDADMVFVLGDLFEFYHGHGDYIYPWFKGVADALKKLTDSGVTVYFLEGNHEFGVGRFFEVYTGVVCRESMNIDIDGKRVFVSHGDELAGGFVRTVLKSRLTGRMMDILGPRLTWIIAMGARIFLSKKKKEYKQKVRDRFRAYALKILDEGFDAVILAHSHMPDRFEYTSGGRKVVYLNAGDFIKHATYISYERTSGFEIKKIIGSE